MRLLVTMGAIPFERTPEGAVYHSGVYRYAFWGRYLGAFDEVRVVGKIEEVSEPTAGMHRADGENVSFAAVPNYHGPRGFLQAYRRVREVTRRELAESEAVIMRVPSEMADTLAPALYRTGRPYGLDVAGDPYDVFRPGIIKHPVRPFMRWWAPRQLRRQAQRATTAIYVTREALQALYPCPGYSVAASNVDLPPEAFATSPRSSFGQNGRIRLLTVGSLMQLNKAPHITIEAVARGCEQGADWELAIVGDGRYREYLQDLPGARALGSRLQFLGRLPSGEPVRDQLRAADLFLLPSFAEGLPRAMIEAMACGLPCLGSPTSGIPELLPPEDLVPAGDVAALCAKIAEMTGDPERMAEASRRGLEVARGFAQDLLTERRTACYRVLREATEKWIAEQHR